ncbi:HlyD family secretion protein [Colwellia sp. 4_MG-2023]|jgi:multidrug resistance efflux pump|uniref:HlyD family secretion protein n=1 Tax=unclassified Colwellia TaxID=196834 RepID=UPI0026E13C03|nr:MULTISPECIES: HlyD family secretion protein [unclassified Colwellia]MDO6486134.1 HlyD family secretion protein [Colwellia sp. 6_MG-2023]MDO6505906.1 HlyD family secretion protein [Colwellia sp. 5_MG-2023]MDO6554587.1 HlyD family secretion protein [Colwellia sp. 4_MG-2023]
MAPDQIFKRWVHVALVVFAISFVYFLYADLWMPVSTQSRVLHPVANISAKVNGQVNKVYINNNQSIQQGQLLFSLDKEPYKIAVDKAKLALESVAQTNHQLDAAIIAAQAMVKVSEANVDELKIEVERVERLIKSNMVSRQLYDKTMSNYQSALAQVEASKADVLKLKTQRGDAGSDNLLLRQARNNLQNAELQLSYTDVRSEVSGRITNLQLQPGKYAQAGTPVAAIVLKQGDIVADFREKSLSNVKIGNKASIIFDAFPGQVFDGKIIAIDAGIKDGQLNADGSLADPVNSDRWVRDAQYMRTHITITDKPALLDMMPSGARATVQLHPGEGLTHWLGNVQAYIISIIHYVY